MLHKIYLKVILNSWEKVFRLTSKLEPLKMGHTYAHLSISKELEFSFSAPDDRRQNVGNIYIRENPSGFLAVSGESKYQWELFFNKIW